MHTLAGFAGLASVLYVGTTEGHGFAAHIPLIALGTGLLWFGWYGFNAGSELQDGFIAAIAFLNTTWRRGLRRHLAGDRMVGSKKPQFVGLLTGAVAGLAT